METKKLLKVGEFARLCHTTKETLLHYDRKGLLQPRYISENGYRFYSMEQFFDFDMIYKTDRKEIRFNNLSHGEQMIFGQLLNIYFFSYVHYNK